MSDRSDADQRQRQEEPPPFWEWVVAGIGAVLLLATLGFLGYEALRGGGQGVPEPSVQVLSIDAQRSGFLVRVRVRNEGRATAADLRVAGVLRQDGQELERSETAFEFVPAHSSREAGLFFTRDPRRHALEVRAESYQQP